MLQFLKKLFNGDKTSHEPLPDPDFSAIINQVKKREDAEDIQPGKKIHEFDYHLFSIRLDRDITKNYRITVFQGKERIYSFTVFAEKGEYQKLETAFHQVLDFLSGARSLKNLPNTNLLRGFYFGHK